MSKLLEIDGLCTYFETEDGLAKAVDGVSLSVGAGETLGVVGESGCGKSVTALSILQLIPRPPGLFAGGSIHYQGRSLMEAPERELQRIRGNEIAMIFQEPMTSLNPVFTVGNQIGEAIRHHRGLSRRAAREETIEALARVGIPSPGQRVDDYPHQMSGGMKQRIMIAMALCCQPSLLIADEPTTALDVTIQAQILELLKELQTSTGMGMMLITHDLGVVAEVADRVAVMYGGKVVECGSVEQLFRHPKHPYTLGLFRSLPSLTGDGGRLQAIPGTVPSPLSWPAGCRFQARCDRADSACTELPSLESDASGHECACWHPVQAP